MLLSLVYYGGAMAGKLVEWSWRVATLFDTPPLYRAGT